MRTSALAIKYAEDLGKLDEMYDTSGTGSTGGTSGTGGTGSSGHWENPEGQLRTGTCEFSYYNLTKHNYRLVDNRQDPGSSSPTQGTGTISTNDVQVPTSKDDMITFLMEFGLITGEPEVDGDDVYYTSPKGMSFGMGYTSAEPGEKVSINELLRYVSNGNNISNDDLSHLDALKWKTFVANTYNYTPNTGSGLTPMSQLTPEELRAAIVSGDIELYDPDGNQVAGNNVPTQITYTYTYYPDAVWVPGDSGGSGNNSNSDKDEIKEAKQKAMDALEREYEIATKKLAAQDKILDLQMNQNNTELQACETECESVKSLLEKNIERDFTLFG